MSIALPDLIGGNIQRLRIDARATQLELADGAARLGLPWTAQHVSRAERGRWAPDLPQLVLLAAALDQLPGKVAPVTVSDLVMPPNGDTPLSVALNETVAITADALAQILRGWPAGPLVPQLPPIERLPVRGRRVGYAAVDRRVAAELRMTADEMLAASHRLWGRSLSEERAARIAQSAERRGEPLRQPEKAAITAALRDGLHAELERQRQQRS